MPVHHFIIRGTVYLIMIRKDVVHFENLLRNWLIPQENIISKEFNAFNQFDESARKLRSKGGNEAGTS